MSLIEKNSYWTRVVDDIEKKSRLQSKRNRIRKYDFSVTLPENLRKRVAKILPYEFDEYDRNVFISESEMEAPISFSENEDDEMTEKKEQKNYAFNESTCSEIERLEHEEPIFVLNMHKPLEDKSKTKKKHNFYSSYICKPRKERVKWDSKIYDLERGIWEKTLDEQAQQLMDASAERFADWINSLGSNRESDISKEKIKALFAIEGDRKLLASILTEPKEVKAIAKTVADRWEMPEMAIELKYENYIRDIMKNVPRKIDTVAFGRTIPLKERPWVPEESYGVIKTIYPQELLSFEKLFKGITHLRSTKKLAEFYDAHPNLEKPPYLLSVGLFKQKTKTHTVMDVPLYERLKLKY